MATLSRRDVEHVAHLARVGLSAEEIERLEGELNHILEQYAVLSELVTDHIAPTAQVIELQNVMRADVARPGFDVETALANAPERHGDHFVVPAILGGADEGGAGRTGADEGGANRADADEGGARSGAH